jgi:hypothetical protein
VRGTGAVAVCYGIEVHAWYKSSGCMLVGCVPCVLIEQWLCGIESSSVGGTISVSV